MHSRVKPVPGDYQVMHVALSLDPGGTERIIIELAKAMMPTVQSVVCCLDSRGRWAQELEASAIPVLELNRSPGFHPKLSRQILALAKRHNASILHCHHYSPFVYGMLAKLCSSEMRLVYTEHGRLSDDQPSKKRLLANQVLGWLPGVFCSVSAQLKVHMIDEGFRADSINVIHNGIDPGLPPTDEDRREARAQLGVPADSLLLGTIARLDPVKDLGTMIEGFAAFASHHPHASLIVIGDGPQRAELESITQALGVTGKVIFAGHRDDARKLLPALDIYLNTSITEGISLTILEAMAAQLPVIVSRVGGNPEIVAEGKNGELFESRVPSELTDKILALSNDTKRRKQLAEQARVTVEKDFSHHSMAGKYQEIYAGLSMSS